MSRIQMLFNEYTSDDQVECIVCERGIPDKEFNALDPKYQADPVCETCWHDRRGPDQE